jgi:hypothetical protein
MRSIGIVICLFAAPVFAKPSAEDVKGAVETVKVFAEHPLDDETRGRLLLQGCSELAGCAAGCQKAFEAAAHVEPVNRPILLAAASDECPAIDFKARYDKNPKLTAEAWIVGYWKKFLDGVAPLVPKADQAAFKANRKKAKL